MTKESSENIEVLINVFSPREETLNDEYLLNP